MNKKKALAILASLDHRIQLLQEYTSDWQSFFNYFADGSTTGKITGEKESRFFQLCTKLARQQYRLRYFIGKNCPGDDKMLGILSEVVSLTNINEMSEAQFNKLQHAWHVIFIALNKSLGKLLQEREQVVPHTLDKKQRQELMEKGGLKASGQAKAAADAIVGDVTSPDEHKEPAETS